MFVDYAKIYVEAGDGGDGCISFRREKYVPRGGPDGGDGGRGGHVILVVDPHMTTLLDLKMRPHYVAKRGQHGGGNQCSGKGGEDVYVKVPLGTVVSTTEGEVLADLTRPGQEFLAAAGGRGGKGNQHFASSTNKAPRKFEYGGDGEKRTLVLELKVIADIGLVGLPNAGKSTLLSVLTAATPKVGAYPFTTLHPNLGVLEFGDETRCVLADIPGLIEGASQGAGLGDRFLRHIERTNLLVHLVAPPEGLGSDEAGDVELAQAAGATFETYWYAWELVNAELRTYGQALVEKPQITCLTKMDLLPPEQADSIAREFQARGIDVIRLSAHTGEGVDELKDRLHAYVLETLAASRAAEEKQEEGATENETNGGPGAVEGENAQNPPQS